MRSQRSKTAPEQLTGLDSVVVWPRLYPLLSDRVKAVVDDLRDGMDAAVRLTATGVVTATVAAAILAWRFGDIHTAGTGPACGGHSRLPGCRAGPLSATAESVTVAFDLHRFDLLAALHLETPAKQEKEVAANTALSDFLRQGVPLPFDYAVPAPSTGSGATEGTAN